MIKNNLTLSSKVLSGKLEPLTTMEAMYAQQQQAAERLRERYSQVPSYAKKAARDPNFWMRLAESRINFI